MNKRIEELMTKAKAEVRSEEEIEGISYDDFDAQVMVKFAELIVMECVGICDDVQRRYGQYTFTATKVKEEIKERFGVE